MTKKATSKTEEQPTQDAESQIAEIMAGVRVRERRLEEYMQDNHNANLGTDRGRAMVDASIREHKIGRSLVADKDDELIAGNKTYEALRRQGITKAIEIETEGDVAIIHKRRDLDLDEDDGVNSARGLAYGDNASGEANLRWDAQAIVEDQQKGVNVAFWFQQSQMDQFLQQAGQVAGPKAQENLPEMDLEPFEHYDYIMIVFRTSLDWSRALDYFESVGLVKSAWYQDKDARKSNKIGLCHVLDGQRVLDKIMGSLPGRVESENGQDE